MAGGPRFVHLDDVPWEAVLKEAGQAGPGGPDHPAAPGQPGGPA